MSAFAAELDVDGAEAGVSLSSPAGSWMAFFFLGLSWTEMVVPKRECREEALRAISRRPFSSA